jgi:succinyl-CoA synthetase beta subunit
MLLLEHDAKELLAANGVAVPAGMLVYDSEFDAVALPPGPWVVKAQIAAGGRGKAGLIRTANSGSELRTHLRDLLVATLKGMHVRACRVESQVTGVEEAYLSLMLDPVAAGVRLTMAARGGVEIESLAATPGAIRGATAAPQLQALVAQAARLTTGFAPHIANALNDAARKLAGVFLEAELTLLEINPLFVHGDGNWIAGDAKVVTDDNALFRQPRLRGLLDSRASAYPEAHRKQQHGCDYVVVDPGGEIGLLTTGAGLSMMLIDELRAAGLKPYNFLDVRTGGLRGDATRLVSVLNWIAEGRRVRVLLVNIFAGITDLGEFARLLTEAFARTPQLKVPVVARLVGTGLEAAREFLAGRGIPVVTDLGAALDHVRHHLAP